jgi:hypothetical protein
MPPSPDNSQQPKQVQFQESAQPRTDIPEKRGPCGHIRLYPSTLRIEPTEEQVIAKTKHTFVLMEVQKQSLLHFIVLPRDHMWHTDSLDKSHVPTIQWLAKTAAEITDRYSTAVACREFLLSNKRKFSPKTGCRCTVCNSEEQWPHAALEWLERNQWMFECRRCARTVKWTRSGGSGSRAEDGAAGPWSGEGEVAVLEQTFGGRPVTFHYGFEVVPDLRHLQLHILSTDFAYVTDPYEWNRWTTEWSLLSPTQLISMLTAGLPVTFGPAEIEAKRKGTPLACHNCKEPFAEISQVKAHLLTGDCPGKAAGRGKPKVRKAAAPVDPTAVFPEAQITVAAAAAPAAPLRRDPREEEEKLKPQRQWEPLVRPPLKLKTGANVESLKSLYLKWWDYYYNAKARKETAAQQEAVKMIKELAAHPLMSEQVLIQMKVAQATVKRKYFTPIATPM